MNLDIYTTEMSKSIWDKAFFIDKIPGVKYVVDFGCADGAMIHYLAPLFPDIKFIGYDISAELVDKARAKIPFYANAIFFNNSELVVEYLNLFPAAKPEEICVNFSSVLHEVFSSTGGVETIQYLINTLKPRYITIRDMYCDEHIPFNSLEQFDEIWNLLPAKESADFVEWFGPITQWCDMMHLLMKLQWKDNGWEDEMKEDYFSWRIDDFIDMIKDYIPAFDCRYQLPYLSEKWKKEYGFYNPDLHTHAQFILRRDD